MRLSFVLCALVPSLLVTSAAFACGGSSTGPVIVEQPVIVAQESANDLIIRARSLENSAASQEQAAQTSEKQAVRRSAEARRIRLIAADLEGFERSNLLSQAGELELSADRARDKAERSHARARTLRAEARQLRNKAAALNGNGMHHRRRMMRRVPTSTI